MENVVNFPTKSVRDKLIIERAMKEALEKTVLSESARTRIVENMKVFYEVLEFPFNFSVPISFPGSIPKDQRDAICSQVGEKIGAVSSEQLQAFTNKLFFNRLYYEIDVCGELGIA
jgi:hypothetical protein